MCDIQILTGLGILLGGYIKLSCYVSAYHWQLVVYLAWLSNLTHIACLTVLRGYLHHHQRERNTRFVCMTVLWLGLFPAMVPTIFFNWGRNEPTAADPASNAICFLDLKFGRTLFDRNYTAMQTRIEPSGFEGTEDGPRSLRIVGFDDTKAFNSTLASISLLLSGYFTRSIKLVRSWSNHLRIGFRESPFMRWLIQRVIDNTREQAHSQVRLCIQALVIGLIEAAYLLIKHYADLLTSEISDVGTKAVCP